jgi:hypothetical protein
MTIDEIIQLVDEAVASLKTTTTGYTGHKASWYTNTTTNWYKGLSDLTTVVNELRKIPAPAPAPTPTPVPSRWYVFTSWVNAGVPSTPVIDPNSAAWEPAIHAISGIWGNGTPTMGGAWSATVYLASGTEPPKTITLDIPYNGSTTFVFPHFGTNWVPSPDTDGHIIIINPDGSVLETQGLNLSTNHAHSVGDQNVITNNGAGGLVNEVAPFPVSAGFIRASEVAAGVIPHGIRCAVPSGSCSTAHRYPAKWSDGSGPISNSPPCGACLWLPRSFDISGYNPYQQMVLKAIQNFGLWIGDSGGSQISIPFESTADGSTYPFSSFSLPQTVVQQLRVLDPSNFITSGV